MSRGRWSAAALPTACVEIVADPSALCECAACSASAAFLCAAPTRTASFVLGAGLSIVNTYRQSAWVLWAWTWCFFLDYNSSFVYREFGSTRNAIKMADSILIGVYRRLPPIFSIWWTIAWKRTFALKEGWVSRSFLNKFCSRGLNLLAQFDFFSYHICEFKDCCWERWFESEFDFEASAKFFRTHGSWPSCINLYLHCFQASLWKFCVLLR